MEENPNINIEPEEIVDFNLTGEVVVEIQDNVVYEKKFFEKDTLFIIIYEEDGEPLDKLILVTDILQDENTILCSDENENDEKLLFDVNDNLIMETDSYKIVDVEKVEELLEIDEDVFESKDDFPDIDIDIEEIQNKKYTNEEKRENVLNELITIYKAYDNDLLLYQISDMVDQFMDMYLQYNNFFIDDTDTLLFIKNMIYQKPYTIPKWLIPIVDNKKKLYIDDDEGENDVDFEETDAYSMNFKDEVEQKYNLLNSLPDNNYKKVIEILFSYYPYENKEGLLLPYYGTYLRNCEKSSPCSGINKPITFDMNRTRDKLQQSVIKDKYTNLETIIPNETISLSGFHSLPHVFLDYTMDIDSLSLHELYCLSDYKYSYNILKKRFKNNIETIIHSDSNKENINLKEDIYTYKLLDKKISIDELGLILKKNIPGYSDLLDSIPKSLQSLIYNYSDFRKAYLPFNITYSELDIQNRTKVNEMIENNIKNWIRNYNKKVKRKVVKNVKQTKKLLSFKERVILSRKYIMNIPVLSIKNNYLKMYIDIFSRKAKADENKNYLYEKNSNDKLLCNHYLYSIQSHKDPSIYNSLVSKFGDVPEDGFIPCKICKEYICSENFSLLEGFSDGVPSSSREVLETNDDELKILTEKQGRIKRRIKKISSMYGVELNQYDTQQIIEFYDLFNNESLIDERYNMQKAFDKHPRVKEVKSNYKFVKPAKTQSDKINNKKQKELMMKELSSLKEYFLDSNEIFIDIFLILFLIQTSVPSYPINSNISINLWNIEEGDTWESMKQNPLGKLSIDTIDLSFLLLKKIISYNKKDKFWNNINVLLQEEKNYKNIDSFQQQFFSVSSFILRNGTMIDKLKNYISYKANNDQSVYTKEHWDSYKPSKNNKTVVEINEKINSVLPSVKKYLLKIGGEYLYSNISTILSFKQVYEVPRFKQLNIPFSEIMKNESYERLFKYSLQLHGATGPIPYIDNLIKRFIQTVNDDKIIPILQGIGWNNSFKKLNKINYSSLRKCFALDIIEHFQKKDKNDIDTMKVFFHYHINNWNGMLINGNPKRNYYNTNPIIFPEDSYETLLSVDEGVNIPNELFQKFCIDSDGNITEKYSNDVFITNLLPDPSMEIERDITCEGVITKTKANFEKILEYKRNINKIPIFEPSVPDLSIESRIKYFLINNNYLDRDAEDIFPLLRRLAYDKRCCSDKEYRSIFNELSQQNSYFINHIQSFFDNNQYLDSGQIMRFKASFGRNIESLSVLLTRMMDNTNNLSGRIYHSMQIISRLTTTTDLNVYIPKNWKISDTNQTHLQDFLSSNEFLQHFSIFTQSKNDKSEGYYKYKNERKYKICFQGLLNHIHKYFEKDLHTIIGNDNSQINTDYNDIFNRYIFLFFFDIMIEYIEDLQDDESIVSSKANMLFTSLEEQDRLERIDSVKICTQFIFDLMIDMIEEFIDVNWIYQTENLNDVLSRQKEREKQTIIDTLESQTTDSRLVMVQQQNCGLSNYFHDATRKNLSYINTEEYKNSLNDERSNFAKEFFSQATTELEVFEGMGVDTSLLQPGLEQVQEEQEQDEGYEQRDLEGIDEGDDEGDNYGDYKEN